VKLALVTTDAVAESSELPGRIGRAVEAGVDLVQVRVRGLETGSLVRLTRAIHVAVRAAAGGRRVPVVVNGRIDVALAAGVEGVHLPARGLPPVAVRAWLPPPFLIGRSAHSPSELDALELEGADYVFQGPVFATPSHPGQPGCGRAGLEAALEATRLPVWAIGGIAPDTAPGLRGLRLAGVAVIRAVLAPHLMGREGEAVARLRAALTTPA